MDGWVDGWMDDLRFYVLVSIIVQSYQDDKRSVMKNYAMGSVYVLKNIS